MIEKNMTGVEKKMKDLLEIREEIDRIDGQMIEL